MTFLSNVCNKISSGYENMSYRRGGVACNRAIALACVVAVVATAILGLTVTGVAVGATLGLTSFAFLCYKNAPTYTPDTTPYHATYSSRFASSSLGSRGDQDLAQMSGFLNKMHTRLRQREQAAVAQFSRDVSDLSARIKGQ